MTEENNNILIRAEGLTKTFKNQVVVSDLSIDLKMGERVSLSGPNGAGKTTLIRCILGQYVYDGKLEILGKNPRENHEAIMHEVGFVPQIPPPLKMTIREMLDFFSRLTGSSKDVYIKISKDLGLNVEDNLSKPFMKLSGGMKQKLLVAFALGRTPKILLMDEPAANLDPDAREVFFKYLRAYDKNTLMILCSHRMSEISPIVNRELEMDLGKIVVDRKN